MPKTEHEKTKREILALRIITAIFIATLTLGFSFEQNQVVIECDVEGYDSVKTYGTTTNFNKYTNQRTLYGVFTQVSKTENETTTELHRFNKYVFFGDNCEYTEELK